MKVHTTTYTEEQLQQFLKVRTTNTAKLEELNPCVIQGLWGGEMRPFWKTDEEQTQNDTTYGVMHLCNILKLITR